ncbi:hypothetical protein OJ998_32400 [Solirubrobacter taibaiensis]|nr:hypothetical protein [Solirubrobacter taibaiensis]
MKFPRILIATAALAFPAAAHAAPPWSAPVSVSSQATAAPHVLFAGGAGTVAFNGTGATFARPVLRAPLDGSAQATEWPGAAGFDTTYGAFAGGERALYVGSNGEQRVLVGQAAGPDNQWRTSLRGPKTGGARAAAAPGAAVFGTFDPGYVYLVRQEGQTLGPTQKLSGRGSIRSVAVASNAGGDILAVWDRAGKIEARYWYASSERLSDVKELGTTDAALKLSVSLGDDRRAVVGWIDQRISEGEAAKGSAWATARTATRGFRAPKQLDTYGNNNIAGGVGVKTAPNMVVFSGSDAIKAALVNGRSIHTPQAIAPIAPDQSFADIGLGDLATSAGGKAVVAVAAKDRIWAVPFDGSAFGAPEDVSGPEQEPHQPSVAFSGETAYLAWQSTPTKVEIAQRPL